MENRISLKKALGEIMAEGAVFSITFQKVDGCFGEKKRVMLQANNSPNFKRKVLSRNGLLKAVDLQKGHKFNVYIDLLRRLNGVRITHHI